MTYGQCVDQVELEKFDGVSAGKYTIGLGQQKMSFCDDREDTYSIALTAVSSLLKKYSIDPKSIGRMEVGTETLLDKSKSCKSVLMQLFEESGNTNIEGVDTYNACYGGTNALFNAVNWVESGSWDGRDAIVVAGDIALYKKGAARPTGGAGCVAMLVGADAPLAVESGLRGSYMRHAYDFYKADFTSEFPIVDGHYSLRCYAEATDGCYKAYLARKDAQEKRLNGYANGHTNGHTNGYTNGHTNGHINGYTNGYANGHSNGETNGHSNGHTNGYTNGHSKDESAIADSPIAEDFSTPIDAFDYACFHSPNCKTVQKSYARLLYNDFRANPEHPAFASVTDEVRSVPYDKSITDKGVEKAFMALTKKRFAERVQPASQVPALCGNMYCGSVYGALVSLVCHIPSERLRGKRVGMFSYGSGLASSMFSIRVTGDVSEMADKIALFQKLEERRTLEPQAYEDVSFPFHSHCLGWVEA